MSYPLVIRLRSGFATETEQKQAAATIERLQLFLGEIAAMGPADEEWDADTLGDAVILAKRALAT